MYLLIDSCSWLQAVYTNGYSQYLLELENYVNSGDIIILTHPHILQEWEKHRLADKTRKIEKLLKRYNPAEEQTLVPAKLMPTQEHLDLQYETVDRLLQSARPIETPQVIANEFTERFRNGLAPLHTKKQSLNDWEIIGSAGHYCQINNISRLFFISDNSGDFGSGAENERAIHPDIQARFPEVKLYYYMELLEFLREIDRSLLPAFYISRRILRNTLFSYKATVKQHDLDSLNGLFEQTYNEVSFIPGHILCKYHPFTRGNAYTYQGVFCMYHVRNELVDLFSQVSIGEKGPVILDKQFFEPVFDYQNKLERVLLRLNGNLIFNLSGENNKTVNVYFNQEKHCECERCCFWRLEFHKSLLQLRNTGGTLRDRLKRAYINYQFGNLSTAYRQLNELKDDALAEKKYIIYFIALHNLRHLGRFLSNPLYEVEISKEEIAELEGIDLLEVCVNLKGLTDYDFLSFIANGNFFKDAFDNIEKLAGQIEDNYYSYLDGGWSSDSHIQQLTMEYASLEYFINHNFIIYDAYSNYDRLFDLATKGLFASHAMKNSESSALGKLDDFWLGQLIFYGNKKTIAKYYNRFKLEELTYVKGKTGTFMLLAENFLSNAGSARLGFSQVSDQGNVLFHTSYGAIFDNLVTLATLLTLDKKDIARFGNMLLKFLRQRTSFVRNELETVGDFLFVRGKYLPGRLRDSYFKFLFESGESVEVWPALKSLTRSYPDGTFEFMYYDKLFKIAFEGADLSAGSIGRDFLMLLYGKVPDKEKALITGRISAELNKQFDYSLFYLAAVYDVINPTEKELNKLLDEIDTKKEEHTFRTAFSGRKNNYFRRLDELINLYFKYAIPTTTKRFRRFKKLNRYYDWVLDMDNFNYRHLDMNWLTQYKTKFYYKRMSECEPLKAAMTGYLRKHKNPVVRRAFSDIYHPMA